MTAVPKLRFSGFGEQWTENVIGDNLKKVIDYRGKAPPKTDTGVFLITARNVRLGYIDFASKEYIDKNLYKEWMNRGLPEPNDVCFTTEAPLGNVCLFPETGQYAMGQRIITLQTKKNELFSKFLYQFLLSPVGRKKVLIRGTGSTAKGIKSKLFVKIPIDKPSVPEQKKIADFLGAVDEKIAGLRERERLLIQYKKGVIQKIFTQTLRFKADDGSDFSDWEEADLKDITKIYDGTHQTPKYLKSGVPFYSVEHLSRNDFSQTKFISEEVFDKENKRVRLEKGDILMTRIGSIGVARYIDWDVRASFYVSLALLKQCEKVKPRFLAQLIKTEYFQRQLHRRTIHVAFPKKINLGEIGNCKVLIPTTEEQQIIADFLSAIDDKITAVSDQVTQMKDFKKGLLQQMFV